MGRWSTGVETTSGVKRIELSYLLKNKYIQKDCAISGSINWTNGSSIGIKTEYHKEENYIRLIYTNTDSTGQKKDFDYKIQLVTVPSNLGKGNVLYFVCPVSGERCRILYKAYGSDIWKSRNSYRNRIYYPDQIENKRFRIFKNLFNDKVLESLYQKKRKSHYKGKPTRLMKRIHIREYKNDIIFLQRNELFLSKLYK